MKLYSVTEILSPFQDFNNIPDHVLERAAIRGVEVHQACAAYASGVWVKSLSLDVIPYFKSFKTWFDNYVDQVFLIEERLKDEKLGFHGRLDFFLRLKDNREVIVDIKTPVAENSIWKVQLSAYKHLVEININNDHREVLECMSLQPNPQGKEAKANVYNYSADDFKVFLSALNAFRYFKK